MKEKPSIKKIILIVLAVIAAIAVFAVVSAAVYFHSLLGQINRVEEQETLSQEQIQAILSETDPVEEMTAVSTTDPVEETTTVSATEVFTETEPVWQETAAPMEEPTAVMQTETEEASEASEPAEEARTTINILLIGQDRRKNEPRQRSDAMILCTIIPEEKTILLTSFMRDTYVTLPGGYGKNRLNVPYAIGGFDMLDECLEKNFGVRADHNIEVDFAGFKNVVDAVGGIDIELTAAEARIVEGNQEEGMNHLDGEQALTYARIRKLDDDFGRTNRQRNVLTALYEEAREMSILQLMELMETILPMVKTDMTDAEIIGYFSDLFPIWKEIEIITQSIPGKGEFYYDNIDGMSVVVPYWNKVRQKIADTIGF